MYDVTVEAPQSSSASASKMKSSSNGHQHVNGYNSDASTSQARFATRLIHDGSSASEETGAVINPITLSTTYKQSAVGVHKVGRRSQICGENTADSTRQGFEYTRSLNPNRLAFETLMASLELPEAVSQTQSFSSEERARAEHLPSALAFASGSAVTQAIVSTLVKPGGHIISVGDVYGGERRRFHLRRVIDMLSLL